MLPQLSAHDWCFGGRKTCLRKAVPLSSKAPPLDGPYLSLAPQRHNRTFGCGCHRSLGAVMSASTFSSLFDLVEAKSRSELPFAALNSILDIKAGHALCTATPQLREKFGVAEENDQLVVSVKDIWTGSQVWWNAARTKKPQTFRSESAALPDSTLNGKDCDFCRWETLTATDAFGRIENGSCVTASNLFKYAFPCHGLVLFKHHSPLELSEVQVRDLLAASAGWFKLAGRAHPQASYPLFLWNCLPRAGASQYHGHAQTLLTEDPVPAVADWRGAVQNFKGSFAGEDDFLLALREGYQSVGLLRELNATSSKSYCFASLAPTKDMEVVILGHQLTCPAFSQLLHGVLRSFIEQLSVTSYNVATFSVSQQSSNLEGPIVTRVVSRGALSSKASDFGALEVFGRASIGHTDPYAVVRAIDIQLQGHSGYGFKGDSQLAGDHA